MITSKQTTRENMNNAIEEFLLKGGKIETVKPQKVKSTQKVGQGYTVSNVGRKSVTLGRI